MTILEALIKLRDDLKLWCINNFNNKLNKNLGAEDYGRFLFVDENGDIDTSNIEVSNITNLQSTLDSKAPTSHTHTAENISDLTTYVLSLFGGYKIRVLSETEYANLGTYDASTLYFCYK